MSHPTFPRAAPLPNTGPGLSIEQITHQSCDAAYKAESVSWARDNCIGGIVMWSGYCPGWPGWRKKQKYIKANSISVFLPCLLSSRTGYYCVGTRSSSGSMSWVMTSDQCWQSVHIWPPIHWSACHITAPLHHHDVPSSLQITHHHHQLKRRRILTNKAVFFENSKIQLTCL